jgi:hypothetical protein
VIAGRQAASQQSVDVEGILPVSDAEETSATTGDVGTIDEEIEEVLDYDAILVEHERVKKDDGIIESLHTYMT